VRPHRHPSKAETLTVLEGRAAALTFDDAGAVVANVALDAASTPLWHVAANTWHGLEILSDWLVFYEVSPGPFHAGSSEFPAWAPASV
jgi:cupin fold WbuC family metalloprotein